MNNQDTISNHMPPQVPQVSNTIITSHLPESADNLTTASLPAEPNNLNVDDALSPSDVHTANTQAQIPDDGTISDIPETSSDLAIDITPQALGDATASITICNIPTTAIASPIEEDITSIGNTAMTWSITATRGQSIEGAELAVIFESLRTYFHGRVDSNDVQALTFCLHHLFCCSARLYQDILPELTASISHQPSQTEQAGDIPTICGIWDHLQAVESLFERIESLCYLLNSTILTILDILQNTCRVPDLLAPMTRGQVSQPSWVGNVQLQEHPAISQEDALTDLSERLRTWQQSGAQRPIFAHQFAELQTIMPTLVQVDTAFDLLQEHTNAIFGNILTQFLSIAATDDEAATLLLLDLMQKADELQFYMRVQLEPMYVLLQQHI